MNSVVTVDFMACFARLPAEVREQARRAYQIWRANPSHPSLPRVARRVLTRVFAGRTR